MWTWLTESRTIIKVGLLSVAILAAIGLLLLPLLTVDAGESASPAAQRTGLAFMARQNATDGIILLGSVLVLIIVGGALRVLNQDRLHRPHLLRSKKNKEDSVEAQPEE